MISECSVKGTQQKIFVVKQAWTCLYPTHKPGETKDRKIDSDWAQVIKDYVKSVFPLTHQQISEQSS